MLLGHRGRAKARHLHNPPTQPTCRTNLQKPGLQAGVFFCWRRRGLAGERRPDDAAVLIELHAQREAHLHQYIFDLVERFAAEVFGLQHFVLALLHEFADGLDVGVLQAIVGADGEFQLFHRTVQVLEARVVGDFLRELGHFGGLFEIDEDAHEVFYQLGGQADRVLRSDGAVGPDFDHELFVVGHLTETCGFDRVVDLADRRVDGVHRDVADGQVFVVVAVGGYVAAAILYAHFDLELATFAYRGDVDALVEDGEVGVFFDLGGGYWPGSFHVEIDALGQVGVELDGDLLEIEDDVRGVFDYAGNRRKFVQDAFDFYGGDGCAFDRA